MSAGAKLLLFWIASAAVIGVVFFIWAWRSGQFRNIEEAKYRMLEDREPAPWPGREKTEKGSGGADDGAGDSPGKEEER
jgi:cbb3-type cytochrome oxidase maturation protein